MCQTEKKDGPWLKGKKAMTGHAFLEKTGPLCVHITQEKNVDPSLDQTQIDSIDV